MNYLDHWYTSKIGPNPRPILSIFFIAVARKLETYYNRCEYITVSYITVRYIMVRYITVRYKIVQYITLHYRTVQ
jgi:hypothetical protein